MEHIQGFTQSHWMLSLVKWLRRIALAAAMVGEFEWNTQNTNKTQLLACNYGTFRALVNRGISYPKTDFLLRSLMQQASFKCEAPRLELKSSRSFLAIKGCQRTKSKKVIKWSRSPLKSWISYQRKNNNSIRFLQSPSLPTSSIQWLPPAPSQGWTCTHVSLNRSKHLWSIPIFSSSQASYHESERAKVGV